MFVCFFFAEKPMTPPDTLDNWFVKREKGFLNHVCDLKIRVSLLFWVYFRADGSSSRRVVVRTSGDARSNLRQDDRGNGR